MSEEIAQTDANIREIQRLRGLLQTAEADYAMLRAVARRIFDKDADDQAFRDLLHLATTDSHPGVALSIRYNRLKAVLEAARKWAVHDGLLAAAVKHFDGSVRDV